MTVYVLWAAKDVDEIDVTGDFHQPAIDLFTKDSCNFWIIDRHGHHREARRREIFWHIESGLIELRFCLDTENSNAPGLQD